MVAMRILAVLILAMTFAACGKKIEAPAKTTEQTQAEKDAATKAVRDNPVYGDQFKALDKAKATAAASDEAAKKTEDALKQMDNPK
ncbi:MAG: hypothetical protein IPP88_08025 [Betaproteobacteria bacterium]|nr:hypothetical protein [Betaproteobacteria bacterium]